MALDPSENANDQPIASDEKSKVAPAKKGLRPLAALAGVWLALTVLICIFKISAGPGYRGDQVSAYLLGMFLGVGLDLAVLFLAAWLVVWLVRKVSGARKAGVARQPGSPPQKAPQSGHPDQGP